MVGWTITSGSTRPVGLITCSAIRSDTRSSYALGVADKKITWLRRSLHSSKVSGLLSSADGSLKPCSTRTRFAGLVALVLPVQLRNRHVALVQDARKSSGKKSSRVWGGSPCLRPSRCRL